jgi:hypothetical protein
MTFGKEHRVGWIAATAGSAAFYRVGFYRVGFYGVRHGVLLGVNPG